jgi:hypothetical protein
VLLLVKALAAVAGVRECWIHAGLVTQVLHDTARAMLTAVCGWTLNLIIEYLFAGPVSDLGGYVCAWKQRYLR